METERVVTDLEVLALAGTTYLHAGSREQAISDELGMTGPEFWLRVNRILDAPTPAVALQHGPLINRLRRVRARGLRARTGYRAG